MKWQPTKKFFSMFLTERPYYTLKNRIYNSVMCEKGLYSEFFWYFSTYILKWIWRDCISMCSVWISKNMDQHNSKYGHFACSVVIILEYAVRENPCSGIFYAVNIFSWREWSFTSNHAMIAPKEGIRVLQWCLWYDDKDLDAKRFPVLSNVYFRL